MTAWLQRRTIRWWTIGLTAFVVRVVAALALDGFRHPELNEYNSLARAMVRGQGFVYGHIDVLYYSYAPPLYSWLSAASYKAAGSIAPAMLLQVVAGAVVAVLAAAIAERIFGGWVAGLAAGLLVAAHPGLVVYNAVKAHPLTFDAFFFTLVPLLVLRLAERTTIGRAVALGLVVGIGTLSRGTLVIFLPLGIAWLMAVRPIAAWRTIAGRGLVAVACASAIIAPWSIRNTRIHHQFVWLLTTDSEDFWRGNNPNATGHSYIDPEHLVLHALRPDEEAELARQPDELAQSRWFMSRAKAFIAEHPDQFVRLTALKFYHFWWFAPQTGVLYPTGWAQAYQAYYVAALVLAVAGLRRAWRNGAGAISQAGLLVLLLLALSGLQSLYYVEGRHRWAVEPMLLVFSGGGVAALLGRRASGRPPA
jgi:4-amino-4-deoxy-L-arabinose transferase-like glycosyltransferase